MKKIALSIAFIAVSAAYVLWQNVGGQQPVATAASVPTTQVVAQPTAPPAPTAPPPTPTPAPAVPAPKPRPTGQYTDGAYTGSVADAYYGLVQVQAIIRNGQLVDVQFLQYPSDRSTSRYINSQAMPMLTQEALQVQNANVDGVSGATDTSQAFVASLASALVQAKS